MRLALPLSLLLAASCAHVPPRPRVEPVDVSRDLAAVIQEHDGADACARYHAGRRDRRTVLLCGKWMFFYETLGTSGVPAAIPKFLIEHFPDEVGPGFAKLGMIEDPGSKDHLPIGLAPGKRVGAVEGLSFTCASCHFARLADGRYAVGAANHHYQYGKQILELLVFPLLALDEKTDQHDAQAVAALSPLLERVKADPKLKGKFGGALLTVIPAGRVPSLTRAEEHAYASWPPGTMDFLLAPSPIDDHADTVSKITPLWGVPTDAEVRATRMKHAMLGWTGAAPSQIIFLRSFLQFGGGNLKDWPDDKLYPLLAYVESLKTPPHREAPAELIARGRELFRTRGCLECHDGPRGGGKRIYSFEEIGTDAAMKRWLDPELTGKPCCNAPVPPNSPLTHGIKSPRLTGAWAQHRFLHNGALANLEELFCITPRPRDTHEPLGAGGHDFTCGKLTLDEKRALIAYVESL
jgi:mono/diheme cytochrome c family protein